MSKRWSFDNKYDFVEKLKELKKSGAQAEDIDTLTPFHVHEVEHILHEPPSKLKFFTLLGALTGFSLGFGFTIYTVLDWPLITGGKPLISIPPFVVIAFALTILIGAIVSFKGFLFLSGLPNLKNIIDVEENDNSYVIIDLREASHE